MKRKCLAVGIILLFIGTAVIPLVSSEQANSKKIITVDDEPGDADYTSIKEALNHSSPGDTIEVYSGTYNETNIDIKEKGISLIGLPYDPGNNDTGQPIIRWQGGETGIIIDASNVKISGFQIIKMGGGPYDACIGSYSGRGFNNIISNNTLSCPGGRGIDIIGTFLSGHDVVSYNRVDTCEYGIFILDGFHDFVFGNRISNCSGEGVEISGVNNTVYDNTIENNNYGLIISGGILNHVRNNNFINNACQGFWVTLIIGAVMNRWVHNYWGSPQLKPYPIYGVNFFGIVNIIVFIMTWGQYIFTRPVFDWYPAQQPFDIPGMR